VVWEWDEVNLRAIETEVEREMNKIV